MVPVVGSICPKMAAPISTIARVLQPCDVATPPSSDGLKSPSLASGMAFLTRLLSVECGGNDTARFPRLDQRKPCSSCLSL